jgi:uncharacterized lipoprotein YehR (DUF1307 family)
LFNKKKTLNYEKLISLLTALFLLVSISSCSDNESTPGPSITTFSAAMLMGSNEVPTNNSTAGYQHSNLTILQKYLQSQ